MCGICGFNFEDKKLVKSMCHLLEHRGPDDEGFYTDSNISMGMRRLSIIDLQTGSQPQHNEDGTLWIIFNGEIYNFQNLRTELEDKGHNFYTQSDTEVILHSYEEWGESCLQRFNGQFAFCIYNSIEKKLFLARDQLGLKPLYYYHDKKEFIFASEIKPILLHGIKRSLNLRSLNFYLTLKYIPTNETLFRKVNKLPPGSYAIFDLVKKRFTIERFWRISFNIRSDESVDLLAKELRKLLEESVKARMISDVPIGSFLSGGIDSTGIVGLMSKFSKSPTKTFSINFGQESNLNETKYANFVADYYNTEHTNIQVDSSNSYQLLPNIVWHLDDLIADAASIPVYIMSKLAKKEMTVALTGDGADEVFAGYSVFYRRQRLKFFKLLPNKLMEYLMGFYHLIPFHLFRILLAYLYQSKSLESRYLRKIVHIPEEEKRLIYPFVPNNVQDWLKSKLINNRDLINKFTFWDLKYQLPNQFNMKVDKMSMAASLEARVPYLDKNIVSWSLRIPSNLKLKGNVEKYILRLALKDLVPKEILNRKKMGFNTPINSWLKDGLKEISGLLLDKLSKRTNIFNPSYIKIIKRNRTSNYFENRTWNLIMFELWYETFMEKESLNPISF